MTEVQRLASELRKCRDQLKVAIEVAEKSSKHAKSRVTVQRLNNTIDGLVSDLWALIVW